MIEKFNKNAKVENFTNMLGIAVRLIVIDPFPPFFCKRMGHHNLSVLPSVCLSLQYSEALIAEHL